MATVTLADLKMSLLPTKHTWLETIHLANTTGMKTISLSTCDKAFFQKWPDIDRFKPLPEELMGNHKAHPLYVGTAAVLGEKDKPLGNSLEARCMFNGFIKEVVYEVEGAQARLVNTVIRCDLGFGPDGKPRVQLFNERHEPIYSDEAMAAASTIFLKFNSGVSQTDVKNRSGGDFEQVGTHWTERTHSYFSDAPVLGLFARGADYFTYRQGVCLYDCPDQRFLVGVEAAAK
jgi:hypothetical protein